MREIRQRVIRQVKKGKSSAFKKLVQHYQQPVYQICYTTMGNRKKAEELAKDTFLYVYSHIGEYDAANRKFSLWLYQTTVALAQCRLREGKLSEGVEHSHSFDGCSILHPYLHADIEACLMGVSIKERLSLILQSSNHFQLSVQEICEVLDTPKSEILTHIWQGRETLRKKFSQSGS
ncbi:sigma factor [Oceanobacillus salinisoli]|uniref:sigma factor n=1 Tax=Oceanobacillus salinisoli TaxID=2678611 RepID=UPI0012E243BE|nr:sigma factor [Oceanobacillus salinisoli]